MVTSVVDRATSDMLIGPDWAMNIEICDMCNRDPGQVKITVKGIKKRLGHKNPKVQLLALTLLETIVKNCGDIVHAHVAEKALLHEMVKLVKKKSDTQVKEKVLILIDTWQETFGGARAIYPQYYAAYQELLRAGAVFPQRSENATPVLTPLQTQPLTSYPQNIRPPEYQQEAAESSAEAEYPTLSMTEIQNARGIMDVLAEMLSAIDPGNKEGLSQEVIVDLVEQCRAYKQRVVHLVNLTVEESLLRQGLALNDDLQRLLAKHEALASGSPHVQTQNSKSEAEPVQALVRVDAPLIDTGDSQLPKRGSTPGADAGTIQSLQLSSLPPPSNNGPLTTQPRAADPKMDLLSGDIFNSPPPSTENSLALVPVGPPQPPSPVSQSSNALALVDMFSQATKDQQPANPAGHAYPSMSPQYQQQNNFQSPQSSVYPNGNGAPNMMTPQQEPSVYTQGGVNSAWNGQIYNQQQQQQPQQPHSAVYGGGGESSGGSSLPPPPWEAQSSDNNNIQQQQQAGALFPQQMAVTQSQSPMANGSYPLGLQNNTGNGQVLGMHNNMQPITGSYPVGLHNNAGNGHFSAINNNNNSQQGAVPNYQQQGGYYSPQQQQQQPVPGGYYSPQQMQMNYGQTGFMYHPQQQQQQQQMYGNNNHQMSGVYGYGYGSSQQQQQNGEFNLNQGMTGLSMRNSSTNQHQVSATPSYVHPSAKPKNQQQDKLFGDLVDLSKFKS